MIRECPHCQSRSGYWYSESSRYKVEVNYTGSVICKTGSSYQGSRYRCNNCGQDITAFIEARADQPRGLAVSP